MNWKLKKALLLLVLSSLVFVEAGLLAEFGPYQWRHGIHQQSERVFPSKRYDPHPDIDWEFESMFRQDPWSRAAYYAVLGFLALVDLYLITKIWRSLVHTKPSSRTHRNPDYS
jgi:hypothetical protein